MFPFCDSKLQRRFILEEEVSTFFKKMNLFSTVWVNFSKLLIKPKKVWQIRLTKPKFEIGFTKAKDELFSHCHMDIGEQYNRQTQLLFQFEKNKTCVFSNKKFGHYGVQFILTEVVSLGYREIKHLYKIGFVVACKCDIFQSNYDI